MNAAEAQSPEDYLLYRLRVNDGGRTLEELGREIIAQIDFNAPPCNDASCKNWYEGQHWHSPERKLFIALDGERLAIMQQWQPFQASSEVSVGA